jgi:hypothetical protein
MTERAGLQLFPPLAKPQQSQQHMSNHRMRQESPSFEMESSSTPQHAVPRDNYPPVNGESSSNTYEQLAAEIPRSQTSFSEAPTLVINSNVPQEIIQRPARARTSSTTPPHDEPVYRSIFPRYDPNLALEHQAYHPTRPSPTQIPRSVINRSPYSPTIDEQIPEPSPIGSQLSASSPSGSALRRVQVIPSVQQISMTKELKDLWKVTNGWRVSASEGRTFCLKMTRYVTGVLHHLSLDFHVPL